MPIMEDYTVKKHLPDTINLHFTPHCNARCKFCFAEYSEVNTPCSTGELKEIISRIAEVPSDEARRVNFVGGEPTIHKDLPEMLSHARSVGLKTSMVTNGLSLLMHGIDPYVGKIDMIGLSIDSVDPEIIARTGRFHRGTGYIPSERHWLTLAEQIHKAGIVLKINTVVNRLNVDAAMNGFIRSMTPKQWKLFQVTCVGGQNDASFAEWEISEDEFDAYGQRHCQLSAEGVQVVKESSDLMLNSYAIIGPNGCFVDNADGMHRYSQPILEVGVAKAWDTVRFDAEAFRQRRSNNITSGKEVAHA